MPNNTTMTPARSRLLGFCLHNNFPFLISETTSAIANRLKKTRPKLYQVLIDKFSWDAQDQSEQLGVFE